MAFRARRQLAGALGGTRVRGESRPQIPEALAKPLATSSKALRKIIKNRGHFPNDDAATKLLFLVLNRAEKEWTMPRREWTMAKAQFAVIFGERFIKAMAA